MNGQPQQFNQNFNNQIGQTNDYNGNGWSKYQILVLSQLQDHNTLLQSTNKEIATIKQELAIEISETNNWKKHIEKNIEKSDIYLESLEESNKKEIIGITDKVTVLSDHVKSLQNEKQTNMKVFAVIVSIVYFVSPIIMKYLEKLIFQQ